MRDPAVIFKQTNGLDTSVDPSRLTFDSSKGIVDLAQAVNVDVDKTGRISRRKGYIKKVSGSFHSLFDAGTFYLGVRDNVLSAIEKDYSINPILTLTTSYPVSYVKVMNKVYFMNGTQAGIIVDRTLYPWVCLNFVRPPSVKTFSDPPIGHLIELYNGRMYIAKEDVVWYSARLNYNAYDLARSYLPFDSRTRLLQAVKSGIYIGTEGGVYFLNGPTPPEFELIKVHDGVVVEGTQVKIQDEKIGESDLGGEIVLSFLSDKGICLATSEGKVHCVTKDKVDVPVGNFGAGIIMNKKYVCTIKP